MKRVLVLIPVFILLIFVSGCENPQGNSTVNNATTISEQDNRDINIPDIISKQQAAMKEISSSRVDVHMEISIKSGGLSNGNISIIADMKSDIDIRNRLSSSVISTVLSMSGTRKEMEQQIIAAGDKIYFKEDGASGAQGQWRLKTLEKDSSEVFWNEQDMQLTGSKYSDLASLERFVYAGKEKSNGHSCLVLRQSMNWGSIMEESPELKEQLQSIQGFIPEEFEKIIEKADAIYLIDEQTFHLREFRIEARINQQVQGRQVTGTINQHCKFDAFNQPVFIEIPEA